MRSIEEKRPTVARKPPRLSSQYAHRSFTYISGMPKFEIFFFSIAFLIMIDYGKKKRKLQN